MAKKKLDFYPVCPYYSCRNDKSKKTDDAARIIKCTCKTSNTNSIMIGFRSDTQKRLHMAHFCRNVHRFPACPVFETIFCIEACGATTRANLDRRDEINEIYKE